MASHVDIGRLGEQLAEDYLTSKEFVVLHRNWRYSRYEIDIIALKNGVPHFVEVKFRSSAHFGRPEESVTPKKIRFLLRAAEQFLHRHPQYNDFRLDILSITSPGKGTASYFFIEDVYL